MVVPIPTLPLPLTNNIFGADGDSILNNAADEAPEICNDAVGADVPIPTLLPVTTNELAPTLNKVAAGYDPDVTCNPTAVELPPGVTYSPLLVVTTCGKVILLPAIVIILPIPDVPNVQLLLPFLTKLNPLLPAPSVAKKNDPFTLADPDTSKVYSGADVLIPTLPLLDTNNLVDPLVSIAND